MYNEELKKHFIESCVPVVSQIQKANAVFGNTEPFEAALGKDICTFSLDELQGTLNKCFPVSAATRVGHWKILRDYLKWCWVGGVDGAKDYTAKVSIAAIDKIKSQMVSTPASLQEALDKALQPESDHSQDDTVRLFCWLVYMGMPDTQTVELKTGDVNLSDNAVTASDGKKYVLPDEATGALRSCTTSESFTYVHPLHPAPKEVPRCDSDQLLRGLRAEAKLNLIKRFISVHMKEAVESGKSSVWLSASRIATSGLYYRYYVQERMGITLNFKAMALEIAESDGYGSPDKPITNSFISDKARLLSIDYQTWKLAMFP